MIFFIFLLSILPVAISWAIVEVTNRTSPIPNLLRPQYAIHWNPGEEIGLDTKLKMYREWEMRTFNSIDPLNTATMDDYRRGMLCYPGPSLINSSSTDTLSVFPTCEELFAYYQKTVNETNELLMIIPNEQAALTAVQGNGSESLYLLLLQQRYRLRTLMGYMPGRSIPSLGGLQDRVQVLIDYVHRKSQGSEEPQDSDLLVPFNGTLPPYNGELPIINIIQNATRRKEDALRSVWEKALNRTFTDAQWQNLTNLVRYHFRELQQGENTTAGGQLKEIITGNGADPAAYDDLKKVLEKGTVFEDLRKAMIQQSQMTTQQITSLVSSFFQSLANLHTSSIERFSQNLPINNNNNNNNNGNMGNLFGGLQQLFSMWKG